MPTLLTREEARERFASGDARYDMVFDVYERFLVLPGPLEIEGAFDSEDYPRVDKKEDESWFDCVLVDGDLTVSGRVRFYPSVPGLLVRGNVKARTLENEDSHVRILGDVEVEQVIFGTYNDGSLGIRGNATAPYFISDGHHMWAAGENRFGTELDSNWGDMASPEEFDSTELFTPRDVERALVPEVFAWDGFSIDQFLDRMDRSLPLWRTWQDIHPGYVRVRAFVKAIEDAAPEAVDRAAVETLRDLDALGFDHIYARFRIVQTQCEAWSEAVKAGVPGARARWGECAEALAGLLPAVPESKTKLWELSPAEEGFWDARFVFNEYGWYVFEHSEDPEELARAVRVMRAVLPWVRFYGDWNAIDTAVRLLLKTGQQEEAFREVRAVLKVDQKFEDFQDIKRSSEYQAWLRKRWLREKLAP